jgi:hypothetical protein
LRHISLWRGFALVNACPARMGAQFLVTGTRLGRGAAAHRQDGNPQNADFAPQWQGDDASAADLLAWFEDSLAVDADVAAFDQRLRQRAAFR